MAKLNDLTNKIYGNWLVLYRNGSTVNKASVWHCRCQLCGCEKDIRGYSLTQGKTTKCRSCATKLALTQPYHDDSIRHIYSAMKQRCYNSKHPHFSRYGGRGVSVCDEWKEDFQAFANWSYSNGYSRGMSIERIDIDGNYEPSNCCFIPIKEQSKNRSNTSWITLNGEKLTFTDACKSIGKERSVVRNFAKRNSISLQLAVEHYA